MSVGSILNRVKIYKKSIVAGTKNGDYFRKSKNPSYIFTTIQQLNICIMENTDPGKGKKKGKKLIIGYKKRVIPGKSPVVPKQLQGKPEKAEVEFKFERGTTKREYTPGTIETGDPRYEKPGGGTNKEMNDAIADARRRRWDVTKPTSKGLIYKAGTTTETKTPEVTGTQIKFKPKIQVPDQVVMDPIYGRKKSANMKSPKGPKSGTAGGSDKKGNPVTKYGKLAGKKLRVRKSQKYFNKP
jgi:hypothetical protein